MTESWERVARRVLFIHIDEQLEELDSATYVLMDTLVDGGVLTEQQIRDFREALVGLQEVIEEDVTPLVEETEPYDGVLDHVPVETLEERVDGERAGEEGPGDA